MEKEFHISDVLSVVFMFNISINRSLDGQKELLEFMTGNPVTEHQVLHGSPKCRAHLLKQFPVLTDRNMIAFANLLMSLLHFQHKGENPEHLTKEMYSELVKGHYGVKVEEKLKVSPLPRLVRQITAA